MNIDAAPNTAQASRRPTDTESTRDLIQEVLSEHIDQHATQEGWVAVRFGPESIILADTTNHDVFLFSVQKARFVVNGSSE